jgi:hypothetical protein
MTQSTLNFDNSWISDSVPKVLVAMAGREFSADSLHEFLDEPMNPNKYGRLFKALSPYLVLTGYVRSSRPERKGGLIRTWRLKE